MNEARKDLKFYQELWNTKKARAVDATNSSRIGSAYDLLGEGGDLLDVGCGAGEVALLANKNFSRIYGVDIANSVSATAIEKGLIFKQINLNTESLPFGDSSFDLVTCLDVIEHVFDPISLVIEINRVLRPQGNLILSTPNFRKIANIIKLFVKGEFPNTSGDTLGWDGGHLHYFTYEDIKRLVTSNGMAIFERRSLVSTEKHEILKKYLKLLLPRKIFNEFLSGGILIKACKRAST